MYHLMSFVMKCFIYSEVFSKCIGLKLSRFIKHFQASQQMVYLVFTCQFKCCISAFCLGCANSIEVSKQLLQKSEMKLDWSLNRGPVELRQMRPESEL